MPEELSKFHAIPMDSSADDVSSVLLARLDHTYERELWSLEDRASYAARHGKPFDATQIHPLQCGACGDPNGLMVHWLVETMAAYDRLDYRPTTTLTSSRLLTMLSYIFTEKPTDLAWDNSLELFRQIFMILNSITSEQWESEHGSEKIGIGARVMVTVRLPDSVLFFAAGHVSGMYLVEDESLAAAHPELGPNAMRSQILGPGLEAHLGRSIFHSDIANRAPIGHIDRIEKVVPSRIDNVHADNRCSYFMLNSMLEVEDLGPMMEGVNPRDTLAVTKAMARFGANKVRKRIGRRAEALAVGAMA